MVVIPCLNEADHIGPLLEQLRAPADRLGMAVIVADGGSTDGTREIVETISAANDPAWRCCATPSGSRARRSISPLRPMATISKISSASMPMAIIPTDYCDRLIAEAAATGADSVVVSMATKGVGVFQKATAAAQNSKLGNGGSPHREGAKGHWTDHGHHALMRVAAFRAVGGYDESFSHNEDAELDYRLAAAGYRIWMTDKTFMVYYPRASVGSLFRQYLGYGRGRAKNILKHHTLPKIRQMIPLMVFPVVAGASLAFLNLAALIPAGLWIAACIGYGIWMAVGQRNPYGPLAAFCGDGHASRLVAGLLAAASHALEARGRAS